MTDAGNTARRAGVIGLGAMGLQMARHMVAKGFDVAGYDVDVDAMRRASELGVKTCLSPAQVGEHAEVVVVMVATDRQVEEVIAQSDLLDRLNRGSVICIASSCAPETCRRMQEVAAARGIGVLDCPVVLGQEAANNGTVTCYVGGEERWLDRARPVLAAFSAQVLHLGPVGTGQIAKTVNNMPAVGVHGGELRIARFGQAPRRRYPAPDRGARPWQRRQLVALPLGQKHW